MSRTAKRTRTTATKTAATDITIRPITREKNGSVWVTHLVQGWKENGKWQRKQFADRAEAETFAALKRVTMENKGRSQQMILSTLTQDQHDNAVAALAKLGETYTLTDAVDYFLRHHRPPEFTIRLADAIKLYVDDKERESLRFHTIRGIKWSLNMFSTAADNPFVHEVTAAQVEAFLRGLRAKNGTDKAPRRSWEIHRGALNAFFGWCAKADAASNRPFTFSNPVEQVRKFSARLVREEQAVTPATTSPADVMRLLSVLMRWRDAKLVKPFAYLFFAGIRPDELKRMRGREKDLVNLKTRIITIPANVSKTRHERKVTISDNLAAWLDFSPGPIIPPNFDRLAKQARKHFKLTQDEARHSFISYHVALHRSVGDAALQAGNSEAIVKRHYLNLHPQEDGEVFFRIIPNPKRRRAVLAAKPKTKPVRHLKVV